MKNKIYDLYKELQYIITKYHINDEGEEKKELQEISDNILKLITE